MSTESTWRQKFRRLPAPALLITVVLCLLLQENFPFSDFPMYARMANNTSYIYLTDSQDNPIPIEGISSIRTGKLKKIYFSKLAEVRDELERQGVEIQGYQFMTAEQRQPAGEHTLNWLYENVRETAREELFSHRPLRFHVVEVKVNDQRKMERTHYLVAEVP